MNNTITTKNLILRPIEFNDLQRLNKMYRNPAVMRYIYDGSLFTPEFSKNRVDSFIQHWEEHGFGIWILIEKSSQSIVGYCGFRYFEDKNPQLINQIEIGYIIDEPFWKKGYASEAVIACIKTGFEKYHFKRILATILPDNIASQKVAVKAGMMHQFDLAITGLIHFVYEITN